MWVLDSGNSRELLDRLRRHAEWADHEVIWCGEGWRHLIEQCHAELERVFPEYEVYLIEQNLGVLRYLARPRRGDATPPEIAELQSITSRYQQTSSTTCEWCGRLGRLRDDRAEWQTLCDECLKDLATSPYPRARAPRCR